MVAAVLPPEPATYIPELSEHGRAAIGIVHAEPVELGTEVGKGICCAIARILLCHVHGGRFVPAQICIYPAERDRHAVHVANGCGAPILPGDLRKSGVSGAGDDLGNQRVAQAEQVSSPCLASGRGMETDAQVHAAAAKESFSAFA